MPRRRSKSKTRAWTNFRPASPFPKGFTACWKNSHYTVFSVVVEASIGKMLYLSIKHNDRSHVHDWRDLQTIKNHIAGTASEAVELYPMSSRLVDMSNQFHLWCLPPHMSFPFGYQKRDVCHSQEELDKNGLRGTQRDYKCHHKDDGLEEVGIAWRYYQQNEK